MENKEIIKISKILDKIDYEKVYIEITTENDKYIIEKYKPKNKIGFRSE